MRAIRRVCQGLLLALGLGLFVPGLDARQTLVAQTAPGRPDLAAMTIRPGDLPPDGWVHVGAFVHSLADQARDHAAYLGRGTEEESVAEILGRAGWQRQYISFLDLPSEADPSLPQQRVRSYVTAYETAEGAASGFAYLEDEGAVVSARDIPLERTFGEESEMTSERGTGNSDGRLFRSLDLTFRIGNLVAGVTLTQYPTADQVDPDAELLLRLARIVEQRAASPETGLGASIVRIEDEGHSVVTFDDAYYRLAGEEIPLAGETEDAARLRAETYADAEHVYQLWQGIDTDQPAGVLYGVTLLEFTVAASAEAWVMDLVEILASNPFYGDIRPEAAAESLGDQAIAMSYAPGGGDAADPHALLVAVRVGAMVARVHLVPQGKLTDVDQEAVLALTRAQVACLQEADCVAAVAVPDELTELLTSEASPDASPVATPQARRPGHASV